MRITMLMPNLPPIVCGVGDHGMKLGDAFKELGVEVSYLGLHGSVGDRTASNMQIWDGRTESLNKALRKNRSDYLWVQYSGYGYSKRGIPVWLVYVIESVRESNASMKIVVCMHETHADKPGLGWRAPFLQPLQIFSSRRIARAAHILFATIEVNLLCCVHEYGISPDHVSLLPIASNIPGVEVTVSERAGFRKQLNLRENARIAVIFGTWETQMRTLRIFRDCLIAALENAQIDHVLAIGGDSAVCQRQAVAEQGRDLRAHLSIHGPATESDIGRMLGCCDVGLVPTPPDYLRKSGVAAAFAAAKLELWQKHEGAEITIVRNFDPFPTWHQIAHMAMKKLTVCDDDCELAYR